MPEVSARGPPLQTESPTEVLPNAERSFAHGAPADFGCRVEEVAPDE